MKKILSILSFILTFSCVLTSCSLPFLPRTETTVTTPEETTVTTPEETIVTTPEETIVTTPEETIVTTPEETIVTTPEETIVTTPEETTTETPEEPSPTSPGLAYEVNEDGATCTITGVGTYTNSNVYIGGYIDGYKITAIGDSAFFYNFNLTSVTIGDSIATIGNYAFRGCTNLASVTIGRCVTTVGAWAFGYCSNLLSVKIGDSVTTIGDDAFYDCINLASVCIYDINAWCEISFADIDSNPLYYAKNLYLVENDSPVLITDFVIHNSVTAIGNYTFYNCTNLTSITIPGSVITIGEDAFAGCSNLADVYIMDLNAWLNLSFGNNNARPNRYGILHILGEDGNEITELVIPDGITTIGNQAFYNCLSITSVTIGNSVVTIGNQAFYNCSDITSVTIGNSVTTIGNYAFHRCSKLTSITIPDSVSVIGDSVFLSCENLTSVTLGYSVAKIGRGAFTACSNLTSFTVDKDNTVYQSFNGDLYSKDGTVLLAYAIGKPDTSFVVPDFVTKISDGAFEYCSNLTSVTIGISVTRIGASAFYGCSNLTSVNFARPYGWWRTTNANFINGTLISTTDLSTPATAAQYLRYLGYYWYR